MHTNGREQRLNGWQQRKRGPRILRIHTDSFFIRRFRRFAQICLSAIICVICGFGYIREICVCTPFVLFVIDNVLSVQALLTALTNPPR